MKKNGYSNVISPASHSANAVLRALVVVALVVLAVEAMDSGTSTAASPPDGGRIPRVLSSVDRPTSVGCSRAGSYARKLPGWWAFGNRTCKKTPR